MSFEINSPESRAGHRSEYGPQGSILPYEKREVRVARIDDLPTHPVIPEYVPLRNTLTGEVASFQRLDAKEILAQLNTIYELAE